MIIVYLMILLGFAGGLFLSRREPLPKKVTGNVFTIPFWKLAVFIKRKKGQRQNSRRCGISAREREELRYFEIDRIRVAAIIIFCGNLVCLGIWVWEQTHFLLLPDNTIDRAEYGGQSVRVMLSARVEGEEEAQLLDYMVEPRQYTREEAQDLYESMVEQLPQILADENEDLDCVRTNLRLVTSLEQYPFSITWESSDYGIVTQDGTVKNENLTEGELITLTARITYREWEWQYPCYVKVMPPVYTKQEKLWHKIEETVKQKEEETKSKNKMEFPAMVEGNHILWQEEKEDVSKLFMLLLLVAAALAYWGKSRDYERKREERKKQLLLEYPEVVNKLTLYLEAGMTIRNAFLKLGEDYKKQKNEKVHYVYEEILTTGYELQSGISEIEAYDHFGKRCQVQAYIKLSTLLSQNLRKGSNELMKMLHQEVAEAFEQRKNLAKKLGEEAGTKLLVPMMIMLCVVMVIIMVPAYFSFLG